MEAKENVREFVLRYVLPKFDVAASQTPTQYHDALIDLLAWCYKHNPTFDTANEFFTLVSKLGLGSAIDAVIADENAVSAYARIQLGDWFSEYLCAHRDVVLGVIDAPDAPQDLQAAVVKHIGDQCPVVDLFALLDHDNRAVRWWAAHHLARFSAKGIFLPAGAAEISGGDLGTNVRAQVLEVIVRQALAGAPWREICAGPMQVNNITEHQVEQEIVKRSAQLGVQLSDRHISLPVSPIPSLAPAEYRQMWRTLAKTASDALNFLQHCTVDERWQCLSVDQANKIFIDYVKWAHAATLAKTMPEERIAVWNKWIENISSTNTDKAAAAQALKKWYEHWHCDFPATVHWCASPREATRLAWEHLVECIPSQAELTRLQGIWHRLRFWGQNPGINIPFSPNELSQLREQKLLAPDWDSLPRMTAPEPRSLVGRLPSLVMAAVGRDLDPFLFDSMSENVVPQSTALARERFSTNESRSLLFQVLRFAFPGQFHASMLAAMDYLEEHDGEQLPFSMTLEAARACGFWWAFADCLIICEKPVEVHLDDLQRLHNESGPALRYSDGWSVYSIRNVLVPESVILHPHDIKLSDIENENNVELRRIMIERYGMNRYIMDSHAQIIDENELGTLYRKNLAGDEPLVMVRVINSTPEPDGTRKEYFLRVPPQVAGVTEAIAWTFALRAEQYKPTVET